MRPGLSLLLLIAGTAFPFAAFGAAASVTQVPESSVARPPGRMEMKAFYGSGFDFWSRVDRIRSANESMPEYLRLLDASFDHPSEGIATLQGRYVAPTRPEFSRWFNRAYFGAGADGLAGGVARNRISPRIEGYAGFTGHLDFGLLEMAPHSSGWNYALGSTVGAGRQTEVDDSVVNLVGGFHPKESVLFYSGFDAQALYVNDFNDAFRARYDFVLQPTFYHSDYSDSSAQYRPQADRATLRWREKSEWTLELDSGYEPLIDVGVHSVLGQQPTPVTFLPRTWDYAHRLDPLPSFGQLVGLGSQLRFHLSSGLPLEAAFYGGYYGGYWGGSGSLRIFAFELAAGSYGVETSSGYQIDEVRIGYVSIGGRFAL